ncbi:PREDICTED: uncharacterized protein LOC103330573 [Prunus mume]|uniref:Uncharacterized protein LOC103330573 n=1 Tax=Prunus mume TaxID=102107 RepID=A0ABM0NXS5_PRUMU|nr:PREDICTED: uncharacterized protein LOC103330573 [Prunus mume]XP_008231391.1 PREDICTED: uncharacterized protein LOC103330573 [Prunus mume]XP_008231392.1 PREDICTED: uncharacterized protein LOC103330573 [Prunus mume]
MGNCAALAASARGVFKKSKALPIETTFKLPAPLPSWPPGDGFASESIDLGGLQVYQISSFSKVWATHEGGPDNLGASFFEPSPLPQGFYMLGCYSQPNNKPLSGWALAAKSTKDKDEDEDDHPLLKKPLDYTLVWNSESLKNLKKDGDGYVWLPTPPLGYEAIGHVVTSSPEKPSLDQIRCVRSDFTDHCEADSWIWGPGTAGDANGFNVFSLRPSNRGTQAIGVPAGTFVALNGIPSSNIAMACLKNTLSLSNSHIYMPNLTQIEALLEVYSPLIYLHPDEVYLPSSVGWFFSNGALLYKKQGDAVAIEPTGSNLPQGGSNDNSYWLDLPVDKGSSERVKKGDLLDCQVYLHIKPMLGSTFTDIAIWIFYPFNGPAMAKVDFFNISLGKIGEHVGDWEHLTLRVSNFTGELWRVFFSQHSGGTWVDASQLEFENGNKAVGYASLHGHALYPKAGLVLQGSGGIGIRNDTAKSKKVLDIGRSLLLVSAEYLGSTVTEPPWLNYSRKWGPNISYDIAEEIKTVEKLLPGKLKSAFDKFVKSLPNEVLGEEGPTGPKMKNSWTGDEV